MQYILVELDNGAQVLQCISGGIVQGYRSPIDGATVTVTSGSRVIDANPAKPSWDAPDPEPTPPPAPVPRRLTKLAFVGRLGNDFATILTAAKTSVEIELFVKMLDWATPDPDGTSVDLDDPRVVFALNQIEGAGLIATGRAAEILNA